jgi:hypothetical protein
LDEIDGLLIGINDDLNFNQTDHTEFSTDITGIKTDVFSTKSDLNTLSASVTNVKTTSDSLDKDLNDSTSGLKSKVSSLDTTVTGLKTKADALTTSVNAIAGGLQIVPTITTATGGGAISLAINSNQTVTSQIVAFRVEFRPTAAVTQLTTMDLSLAALYTTPPVVLKTGSSSGTAVAADHTIYNLYWASSTYNLGSITFKTKGTSIAKGAQTKTLAYTYTGSTVYDVVITPEFESTTTSTGTTAGTW